MTGVDPFDHAVQTVTLEKDVYIPNFACAALSNIRKPVGKKHTCHAPLNRPNDWCRPLRPCGLIHGTENGSRAVETHDDPVIQRYFLS